MQETLAEARKADRIVRRERELATVLGERLALHRKTAELVAGLRRDGVSWARIGGLLGVSRQAAEQRYSVKKS